MKVQLRFDRQTGQWIIVAALRQDHTHITTLAECQLCTSTPGHGHCEVIVFSSDHTGSFAELDGFAQMYLDILGRFDALYPTQLPYMSALHQYTDTDAQRETSTSG